MTGTVTPMNTPDLKIRQALWIMRKIDELNGEVQAILDSVGLELERPRTPGESNAEYLDRLTFLAKTKR